MWGAEAKQSKAWDHTSLITATIQNARMGVKRHQFVSPIKIHPYARKQRRPMTREEGRRFMEEVF